MSEQPKFAVRIVLFYVIKSNKNTVKSIIREQVKTSSSSQLNKINACRAVKLEKYRETDAEVLRYLLRIYFPCRIENNLKQLYSDTLESVVVA